MRRRTFAASVVVTLSLAEAGCDGASKPPAADGTHESIAVNPPAPTPKLDLGNPEEPEPEPQPEPEPARTDDVQLQPDGTCLRYARVECPQDPQVTCNPPPPEIVPCPDAVFPEATNADHVRTRRDGTCWEDSSADFECPEGARCNPPAPRRVQCPTQ